MSGNTLRNILSLWIFVALIALGVGLALFINKINTAPEDSQASALAGTIELALQRRDNVSDANQTLFNVGDNLSFNVIFPTLPTVGLYKTFVLRVQYTKANFTEPSNLFSFDTDKYQGVLVPSNSTNCKPIDATYNCARVDITIKAAQTSFAAGDVIAKINLVGSTITPAAGAKVLLYPATGVISLANTTKDMYSYIANETKQDDIYIFGASVNGNKIIKIDNQCYGDYNRTKGISGEIVDPLDLSRFASKYGGTTQLAGSDQELDIDNRGASLNYINAADLSIFASNYGQSVCNRNKSDGLP